MTISPRDARPLPEANPIAVDPPAASPIPPETGTPTRKIARGATPRPPARVLLIEHRPDDAELVQFALSPERGSGAHVNRVDRVEAAIAALGASATDAVLLDPEVPDSHGFDGLVRLRRAAPAVPVLVLCGAEDPASLRAAFEGGAQEFEVKRVFPKGQLTRRINRARLLQRTEEHLRRATAPTAADRAALGRLSDGVAIVVGGRFDLLNEAAARLLARAKASDPEAVAELLVPSAPPGLPSTPANPALPADGCQVHFGEFSIVRDDDRRTTVRYVRRSFPHRSGPRILIRLKELPPTEREGRRATTPLEGRIRPPVRAHRAPRRSETAPILDPTAWAELEEVADGDPTFVTKTVTHFLADADQKLRELWPAVDAQDLVRVGEIARALRAGSAQVAARILAKACGQLEEAAGGGRSGEILDLARRTEREYQRAATELRPRAGSP